MEKKKQNRIALTRGSRRRRGQEAAHINRQASATLTEAGFGVLVMSSCASSSFPTRGWGSDSSLIGLQQHLAHGALCVVGALQITGEMEMNV